MPGAGSAGQRPWRPEIVTVSNLIRVVCGVILRGLTNCTDNKEHFRGVSVRTQTGEFRRTGAAEFLKLNLFDYEQLIRFWHLADNSQRPPVTSDDHDKCYLVRPIISIVQAAFQRWCTPGQDTALDEGGLPSRHHWLRKRNETKPNRYFIEVLKLCCSKSRFCWDFVINEGKTKHIKRANRRAGQHGYKKCHYKQHEFNAADDTFALAHGITAGQMQYFARRLRENSDDDDYVYHVHVDKRWCSMVGMVVCMDLHKVAFSASVKRGSRYHVAYDLGLRQSTKRANRGKYRCCTTTINDVTVNAVLWQDSKLVAFASTYSGTSSVPVSRRSGRFKFDIACPKLIVVRGDNFRAVDSNDQLCLSDVRFDMISRTKAWPVVHWGVIELVIVNIFIVCRAHPTMVNIQQGAYRWQLLTELLDFADMMDQNEPVQRDPANVNVGRFHPQSAELHHHVEMLEYVTQSELAELNELHSDQNPKRKRPRARDRRASAANCCKLLPTVAKCC